MFIFIYKSSYTEQIDIFEIIMEPKGKLYLVNPTANNQCLGVYKIQRCDAMLA